MDGRLKKLLHHWRKKRLRNWQLVLLFLVLLGLSAYFLRQNNLKMVQLRNAVIVADQNNGDVTGALKNLNQHVFDHMNTQIVRPIELVNSYTKAAKTAIESANQVPGRDIYAEATAACERRGIPLTSIAQCAAEYTTANNPGVADQKITLPDKNLFTHTFAAPLWTPDLAGISVLLTGVVFIWIVLRFIEYIVVRIIVRRRIQNGF